MYKKEMQAMLLCATALTAVPALAQDTQAEYSAIPGGTVTAISPNGKYAVGVGSTWDNEKFSSFIWNTQTKQTEATTKYDAADLGKCGMFNYVNDNGIVAGATRSEDLKLDVPGTDYSDPYTIYFVSAAIWKDGQKVSLGLGDQTMEDLSDEYDGSYATSVSADGTTVAGYIYKYYMPSIACGWKLNAQTGKYDYYTYATPSANALSCINAMSADGQTAVGYVQYNNIKRPAVWTSPETCRELDLGSDITLTYGGDAPSISPNGRYVLAYVNGNDEPKIGVYDLVEDKLQQVPVTDAFSVKGLTVDNFGNFFCTVTDNDEYDTKTYYYSAASNALISMETFMQTYAQGATGANLDNKAVPVAISGDGKNLVGTSGETGSTQSWYLKFDNGETVVSAPANAKAYLTGKDTYAATWSTLGNLPDGVELLQYNVYLDGAQAGTVSAAEAQGKATVKYRGAITSGSHKLTVNALCKKADKEFLSDISEAQELNVPEQFGMPLTDDFESQSFATNYWTKEISGNLSELISWNISGGNVYDYENSSYFASTTSISKTPHCATLTSRFVDAADAKAVPYISFYGNLTYVNEEPTDLGSDSLDIEYALDGETWHKLYTMPAKDMVPYVWSFYKIDLPELAGKVFQLRLNVHGEGKAQLRWAVDYLTVDTELQEAPQGVKAVKNGDNVTVAWKNDFGAYEATYLSNSNVVPVYNVGNGGLPLISAVEMPAEKLADYVGQYITSVSTFIYDDPSMQSAQQTQAEAIIYEDGKEVSRQAFDADVASNPNTSSVALSTPVEIKAGKTYRIAVRIHDYDASQSPLYYQASMEYKPGTTDLYSEDEGKTWQTIYDFNKDNEEYERAYCIWPIRANITETAEAPTAPQLDAALMAYNVYRDGKKINDAAVYSCHKSFVDNAPQAGSTYTVQAFYTDGRVSAESEPATITLTSIMGATLSKDANVAVDPQLHQITISGAYDSATLYSINGQALAQAAAGTIGTSQLPAGTYVLAVKAQGKTQTYKLTVR